MTAVLQYASYILSFAISAIFSKSKFTGGLHTVLSRLWSDPSSDEICVL